MSEPQKREAGAKGDEKRAAEILVDNAIRRATRTQMVWEKISPAMRDMGMRNTDVVVELLAISACLLVIGSNPVVKAGKMRPLSEERQVELAQMAVDVSGMFPNEVGFFLSVLSAAVGDTLADAKALADMNAVVQGGQ